MNLQNEDPESKRINLCCIGEANFVFFIPICSFLKAITRNIHFCFFSPFFDC